MEPGDQEHEPLDGVEGTDHEASGSLSIPLDRIRPNPFQPRSDWKEEDLDRLAASIRQSGVLQPVLVRRNGEEFQLIAGERRVRAARRAGLEEIPAVVHEADDWEMQVLALVENVQRTDLNAIEKARSFDSLMKHTGSSQAKIAEEVGLQRSSVTNYLRLLDLPPEVQSQVEKGRLTMGHARALLSADPADRLPLARQILAEGLSVRSSEKLVSSRKREKGGGAKGRKKEERAPWIRDMEETLLRILGCRVRVQAGVSGKRGGRITLELPNKKEFHRVFELLMSLEVHPSEQELLEKRIQEKGMRKETDA